MTEKFLRKWMKIAKALAEDNTSCYSRRIGAVIVKNNRIIGTGYNGPPSGIPHCGSEEYLRHVAMPLLRPGEVLNIERGVCPRKSLGFKSGEGLEFCQAIHAEDNAIINSTMDCSDATLFISGPSPCKICAGKIIQSGIKEVYYSEDYIYSPIVEYLFKHADVSLQLIIL